MDDNDTEVFFVEIRQSLSVLLKMTIYMHFASRQFPSSSSLRRQKKKIDAQMASGSVKGTVSIEGDARCFIVDAL